MDSKGSFICPVIRQAGYTIAYGRECNNPVVEHSVEIPNIKAGRVRTHNPSSLSPMSHMTNVPQGNCFKAAVPLYTIISVTRAHNRINKYQLLKYQVSIFFMGLGWSRVPWLTTYIPNALLNTCDGLGFTSKCPGIYKVDPGRNPGSTSCVRDGIQLCDTRKARDRLNYCSHLRTRDLLMLPSFQLQNRKLQSPWGYNVSLNCGEKSGGVGMCVCVCLSGGGGGEGLQ